MQTQQSMPLKMVDYKRPPLGGINQSEYIAPVAPKATFTAVALVDDEDIIKEQQNNRRIDVDELNRLLNL